MSQKKSVPAVSTVPAVIPNGKDLYTILEAALRMSTTVFAIRELCRSGKLKFVAIGHKSLISPDAIREFIRQNEQAAA